MAASITGLWLRSYYRHAHFLMQSEKEAQFTQRINEYTLQVAQLEREVQRLSELYDDGQAQYRACETRLQEQSDARHQVDKQLSGAMQQLEQLSDCQQALASKQQECLELTRQLSSLKAESEQKQVRYEEQLQLLNSARKELSQEFENLANRIFSDKQKAFSEQSKATLSSTIDPLKDQLLQFRRKVEDVYDKEAADRNKLMGQVAALQQQTQQIGEDAVNLAAALKGDNKAQGNWGEVVLERLLEESGLQKGREYETQVALKGEKGERRNPDVIIRLPEKKDIIIDAKVSLLGYEEYCRCVEPQDKERALKKHIASLRAHIKELSAKDYERLDNIRSLDFVFIFIPIEAAFMLAMQHDSQLFQEAYAKHIILVSPTTLLATLRTVENIWRYEKQNRNAEKIATQAGAIHDQFVLVLESLDELGRCLDRTSNAYTTTVKRLSTGRGNLVRRVENFRLLGAKTKKVLPEHFRDDDSDFNDDPERDAEVDESSAQRGLLENAVDKSDSTRD